MNTLLKKSVAVFATAAILASTSVTAFAADPVEPAGNYDAIVWIGAKDVKGKDGAYDTLMKSETYSYVGNYSGGKMGVAVVKKGTAADAAAFVKLFDTKGKLQAAAANEGKKYASAKYKDGKITVTAGKTPGEVDVWVYELKKDGKETKVVNGSLVSGAKKAANASGSVQVAPAKEEFAVKAAMTSPAFLVGTGESLATAPTAGIKAPTDTSGKVAGTIAKGDKVVNLSIQGTTKASATIYIADTKIETACETTGGNTFKIAKGEDKGAFDPAVITLSDSAKVEYDSSSKVFKLAGITANGEGKTTITITNEQSGKSLKVPVVVTKYAKVSLKESFTCTMTPTGGTAVTLDTTGKYVAPKTKVTFSAKVKIDGKEIEVGKAVTINKDTVVEEVKATTAS